MWSLFNLILHKTFVETLVTFLHMLTDNTSTLSIVVIDFWDGFIDCNYLSLSRQLIPITITKVANE